MTFKEATYDKKLYLLDLQKPSEERLESITVPVFKELCRVNGNFDDIIAEARSEGKTWQDKYIEVQLKLDSPVAGASDAIRNAFAECGGEVLVVEAQSSQQSSDDDISAEEITTKSPEDIFAAFYKGKYGDNEQQQELEELTATFRELLDLADLEHG